MTKELQDLKKKLLQEELQRQGKTSKTRLWAGLALLLILAAAAGGLWYRATLDTRLEKVFQQGVALRQAGDYQAAINAFSGLHSEHADFVRVPEALYQIGEIQDVYLGDYDGALLTYLLLERDYPQAFQVAQARNQVAVLYKYRLGDCGEAVSVYQKVQEQQGADWDALQYEVSDCYFRMNNFSQARIEFDILLKKAPESALAAESQYRIAVTYALEGLLPEAAGAYRAVMERWSKSPYAIEARFGLATVLEEQEELLEAQKILEGLKGVYPNPDVLERKAKQVQERIDKKQKAI